MNRRTLLKTALLATAAAAHTGLIPAASPVAAGEPFSFPDTPVGRAFRRWLAAFNGEDVAALRDFHRVYSPPGQVEGRTALDMLLRSQTGGIDPHGVVRSAEYELVLTGFERLTENWVEGQMALSPEAPHMLMGIGGRPIPPPADRARAEPLSDADLRSELDRYLDKLANAGAFSGTVLVAREGRQLYARALGLADAAGSVPNGVDTKYNLGSMNKMFTAIAVAQLVEQGTLTLETSVGRYLPDLPAAIGDRVTLHHLLTHTSGLGDFFGPRFEAVKESLRSPRDYFPLFIDQPLRFEPSARWDYSNAGFIVLGAVIEAASGRDYFDHVRERIFAPAGMSSTDSYEKTARVPDLARGYTTPLPPNPADLRVEDVLGTRVDNHDILPRMGSSAGGGYSTVTDLLRFELALRDGTLVHPETANRWLTGVVPLPFSEDERYGYGFQEEHYLGTRISGHGGGFPGVSAKLDIYRDLGYTVAVLSNVDAGAPPVVAKIRELIVRG
jgi:CubicO group peptidase (beta-lactamase class C family)